jgi:hypothetical protein
MIIMSRRFIRFGAVMEAKIRRKHNLSNNDYTRKIKYFGKKKDKRIMPYKEWEMIDELIQNLELVEKGLASVDFKLQTLKKLSQACDSEKTQQELVSLLGKY